METVVRRIVQRYGKPTKKDATDAIDMLQVLTSFESYDVLARGRSERDIADLLSRAARKILGVTGASGR